MKIKIMLTKLKLTITVKTLSKCNDRSRVAAKQTNRLRDTETGKYLDRKRKDILPNIRTCRITSGHTDRDR